MFDDTAGLEAPRNSVEMPVEAFQSYLSVGDNVPVIISSHFVIVLFFILRCFVLSLCLPLIIFVGPAVQLSSGRGLVQEGPLSNRGSNEEVNQRGDIRKAEH